MKSSFMKGIVIKVGDKYARQFSYVRIVGELVRICYYDEKKHRLFISSKTTDPNWYIHPDDAIFFNNEDALNFLPLIDEL